jgi:hypothetical protein
MSDLNILIDRMDASRAILLAAIADLRQMEYLANDGSPVSDDEFMRAIKPLYDNGLGELVESVNIDAIRARLTE